MTVCTGVVAAAGVGPRRLVESAVTFVLVTIVVFLGVRALPGDAARALAGEESDPATLAEIRRSFGLDQPLPVQ